MHKEPEKFILNPNNLCLVVVDVQEKLSLAMKKDVVEKLVKNILLLIQLSKLYKIPVIITEQYPKGLGRTLPEIKELVDEEAIEKIHFSCIKEEEFFRRIIRAEKNQIILTGMEAHICIWQTALDLVLRGYSVFVPSDAVCSRRKEDWQTALQLMRDVGCIITCTEALVFQILEKAGTEEFKKILEFVK
ncbi:MAG: isochorismatase family protein [Thermodesulfovibrio sp.]|nr:isochorismatase family protein [Thermodesulfovibrio sp.]